MLYLGMEISSEQCEPSLLLGFEIRLEFLKVCEGT
jgi:hypothetical protein